MPKLDLPMLQLDLPLEPYVWAYLTIPRRMTPEQWAQMMRTLEAMRPGIVDAPVTPGPAREGANEREEGK